MSPLLKGVLTPGSLAFLLLCLAIWLTLKSVWPRTPRIARAWLLMVVGLYAGLGTPWVAHRIAGRLPRVAAAEAAAWGGVDTIVVLDGDNRTGRVGEASRIYRLATVPAVVVLGQAWVTDALIVAGVPAERLTRDSAPATTREQMAWMGRWLATRPGARVALVASRLHMPRVAALAQAAGLAVMFAPSPLDVEPPTGGPWRFVPTPGALWASRDSLYEHAALAYYRWRGWIPPPPSG